MILFDKALWGSFLVYFITMFVCVDCMALSGMIIATLIDQF
jgi:hypothetical protein